MKCLEDPALPDEVYENQEKSMGKTTNHKMAVSVRRAFS